MTVWFVIASGFGFLALVGIAVCSWSRVGAEPDEWLLHVRGGRALTAGIGLSAWRLPGDLVVVFTSTMQRVGFEATGISSDRLRVTIEGFILWSVTREAGGPMEAFQRLGVANLRRPPDGLKHPKHLLTGPQHRAFQQLVTGCVQRHASTCTLQELFFEQDRVIAALGARLAAETRSMGVAIDEVQILCVAPQNGGVLDDMAAGEAARLREEAAHIRLASEERIRHREIEKAAAITAGETKAKHEDEVQRLALAADLESRRVHALEEKTGLQREAVALEQSLAAARFEMEAATEREKDRLAHEQALAREADHLALVEAGRRRRELRRDMELEAVRARALADRDAALTRNEAEEAKSPEVRHHELGGRLVDRLGEMVRITSGHWIGTDPTAPLTGIGAAVTSLASILGPTWKEDRR